MMRRLSDHHVRGRHERVSAALDEYEYDDDADADVENQAHLIETFETNPSSNASESAMSIVSSEERMHGHDGGHGVADETTQLTHIHTSGTSTHPHARSTASTGTASTAVSVQLAVQEISGNNNIMTNNTSSDQDNDIGSASSNNSAQQTADIHTNVVNNTATATATTTSTATITTNTATNNNSAARLNPEEFLSEIANLEEQRDVYVSSTNSWTIIFLIFILRIILEALAATDIGLTFIGLMCLSYFGRWRQYRALQIQTMDEQIEFLRQFPEIVNNFGNFDEDEDVDNGTRTNGDESESGRNNYDGEASEFINRFSQQTPRRLSRRQLHQLQQMSRLRHENNARFHPINAADGGTHIHSGEISQMSTRENVDFLSFQAQLALALSESQFIIQTIHNNQQQQQQQRGVRHENKQSWKSFEYTDEVDYYGQIQLSSTTNSNIQQQHEDEEELACCICLCEYEKGEKVIQLPCGHAYHSDCIDSWCTNHVRCPLCNYDLDHDGDDGNNNEIHGLDSIV